MFGIMPALKMHFQLDLESNPELRLKYAPFITKPVFLVPYFKALRPRGSSTIFVALTGATGSGDNT